MIKAVIFDYDDTLIKSSEYFFWLEIEVSKKLWLQAATREQYFALRGKPHEEMVKIMHPEIETKVYMQEYDKIYNPNNLVLFDWVKKVIQQLKNDLIKMFILSAKKIDRLEEHTNLLGIREYFKYIHWAESSPYKKPDPHVFDDILNVINANKDEIVEKRVYWIWKPSKKFLERIWDFVIIAKENYALYDITGWKVDEDIWHHGWMTKEEIFVPIIKISCK